MHKISPLPWKSTNFTDENVDIKAYLIHILHESLHLLGPKIFWYHLQKSLNLLGPTILWNHCMTKLYLHEPAAWNHCMTDSIKYSQTLKTWISSYKHRPSTGQKKNIYSYPDPQHPDGWTDRYRAITIPLRPIWPRGNNSCIILQKFNLVVRNSLQTFLYKHRNTY